MSAIIRTESFNLAFRFVTETNLNIFLTGKAGTGKTTFLKFLRENSSKEIVVAAPTGVAAINAGGVTLHSLFHLPFSPFIPSRNVGEPFSGSHSLLAQVKYNKDKLNIFRNLELLIIDETSMVASHTVDAVDTILRSVRRRRDLPFGGVQVLFIGDLYQLPPVVKNQEWEMLRQYYPSIFFFDSIVLREHIPVMVELKEIFRQQDSAFIDILNGIRNNELTNENYSRLNQRLKPGFFPADNEGYITLTTHNQQSDTINKSKLERLKTPRYSFTAQSKGDFPDHLFPGEKELELKVGAQVMFLKNDTEGKQYFNGKIGTVTFLEQDSIRVKCKGETHEINVAMCVWENIKYSIHSETREIREEKLGSYTQYPLRLAWAITIHKSQGLTFDKLVIDAENAFANGQVYVALSRCTSLEGLVLTSPVNKRFLGAHQNLKDWQHKNHDESTLSQKFKASRRSFILKEIKSIYEWKEWHYSLRELGDVLEEFKDELPATSASWYLELKEKLKSFYDVAAKFQSRIEELSLRNEDIESNDLLQQRCKDAASYFHKSINEWLEQFQNHPLNTDTRKVSKKVDAVLGDVNFAVQEILHKVAFCKTGFVLNDYLEHRKRKNLTIIDVKGSYSTLHSNSAGSNSEPQYELYNRIADFRREIALETGLPLFVVFNNRTIKAICENLPRNGSELSKVKGFGKVTFQKYGKGVLKIVNDYCTEKQIVPEELFNPKLTKPDKSATTDETLNLIAQGKSIEEVAKERNLSPGTIESHLAKAIKNGNVEIQSFIPMDEVQQIAAKIPQNADFISINSIKENLPAGVTYGKIKMVIAWMEKEKKRIVPI